MPEIKKTTNYDWFELHPANRLVKDSDGSYKLRPELIASMKSIGFDPTQPIEVEIIGRSHFRIFRGHNRYITATTLGLPIYYIAHPAGAFGDRLPGDDERLQKQWKLQDYIRRGVKAGDTHMLELDTWCKQTGIGPRAALSLLAGHAAASGNWQRPLSTGKWRVTDRAYADLVASVVQIIALRGDWAFKISCVNAVSRAMRAEGLDVRRLKEKLRKHGRLLSDQRGTGEFMQMMEDVYNYGSKGPRFPLVIESDNAMRDRNVAIKPQMAASATH